MFKTRTIGLSIVLLLVLTAFLVVFTSQAGELSVDQIMERVDENQFISSARMESEMIAKQRGRERVMEMITYSQSDGDITSSLTEFVNPRDRGTKYLMIGDDLWMFFPDAEEVVPISGHMLREGMMGSDFSYEDVLESERLHQLYDFELKGEELVNGREAYVLLGTAREDQEVSYYQRQSWVDKERFILLREELFSSGGRLLKVLEVTEVKEFEDQRWFPVEMVMRDKLRQDSETIFRIKEIEFGYDIPEGKLSREALE